MLKPADGLEHAPQLVANSRVLQVAEIVKIVEQLVDSLRQLTGERRQLVLVGVHLVLPTHDARL